MKPTLLSDTPPILNLIKSLLLVSYAIDEINNGLYLFSKPLISVSELDELLF